MAKPKGKEVEKGGKGEEVDVRGLLIEIPAKARSMVLKVVDEVY